MAACALVICLGTFVGMWGYHDSPGEFEKVRVVKIIDGDTIDVERSDWSVARVRFIGMNAPERNTEEGKQASEQLTSMMPLESTVYLQKDVSEVDRYDRLLRYVWMEVPSNHNSIDEVQTKMINAMLIVEGVAVPAKYPPDTYYAETFDEIFQMHETGKTDT